MEPAEVDEKPDLLSSLLALVEESNTDEDLLRHLSILGQQKQFGLRGYIRSECLKVMRSVEDQALDRKIIRRILRES
jgi:hypothetical protein